MNTATVVALVISLVQVFFAKNPTAEAIVGFLPQVSAAIASAKAGTAFSITFPEGIDGHPGTSTFSWSPTA